MNQPARRPDASMDLLNNILRQPLDPDYTSRSARDPRMRKRWATALVFVVAGALIAGGATHTAAGASAAQKERDELIALVEQQNTSIDTARGDLQDLEEANRKLRQRQLGSEESDEETAVEIEQLESGSGGRAVEGDGVVITLDDADDGSTSGTVLDLDLRQAANGLWSAGAEAVAINGHRLSARTAIRAAGSAITVDYRSLTPPYRIEAIGDVSTLKPRFEQSSGGSWLSYLRDTQDIAYDIVTTRGLELPADPGLDVTHASIPKEK